MRELGALDGDGRITAEGKSLRALALPPRLARMIVDSHRLGAAQEAAEIAAVLTERGLGGDSVDLDARLDQFRRDRSQRAASARSLAQRWASQVRPANGAPAAGDGADALSTGVMLALRVSRSGRAQPRQRQFVLANGRGAAVDQASALARAPYHRGRRIDRHRGSGRILLAAPITQEEIERLSPTRSKAPTRSRSTAARWRCAGGARGHCTRSRFRKPRWRCSPRPIPRAARRWLDRRRAGQAAVVEIAEAVARPGDVFAQGGGRSLAGFVRCRACDTRGMAGAGAVRQDRAEGIFGRRSVGSADDVVAVGFACAAGARGADPFRGADRTMLPIDYEAEQGPTSRSGCRNCSG